jgi:SAM-dependent methyltransferase
MSEIEGVDFSSGSELPEGDSGMAIRQLGASFAYWLLAHSYFLPGLYLQRYSSLFALSLAAKQRSTLPKSLVYRLLNGTLESTRYFEFDFAWKSLPSPADSLNCLDVFSPWLLPLLLLHRKRISNATVVSTDRKALPEFRRLLNAANLGSRCAIVDQSPEKSSLEAETFDVITSISGLAQIDNNSTIMAAIWRLLKPGGRLIMSLPCGKTAKESINCSMPVEEVDDARTSDTKQIYDPRRLREDIFSEFGEPQSTVVYGETLNFGSRRPEKKRAGLYHPPPREPVKMARDWRCFSRIEDLPGMGIVAMKFIKPLAG